MTLETRHLRFWEFLPFPVYVAVYVEALDQFYVINIKRWIAEELGDTLGDESTTKTLNIPSKNVLDDSAFRAIKTAGLKPLIEKALKGDTHAANLFCRDDQLVKWIATAEQRKVEIRVRVIAYGSKLRSEVYFEERDASADDKAPWTELRKHWESMMGSVDSAFPYLSFEAREPSELYGVRDKDGNIVEEESDTWLEREEEPSADELHEFDDGRIFTGSGQFEMMEYAFSVELNEVGQGWFNVLTTLEEAELIAIDPEPLFVSVAPFNKDI